MENCEQCRQPLSGACAMMRGMWFHLSRKPTGEPAETQRGESCLEVYLRDHEFD